MNVGIVGASGYAGGELLRILSNHDKFKISYISAGTSAGEEITSIHPHLINFADRKFESTNIDQINKCEVVFLALPHGESAALIAKILPDIKVIDLGADFRLSDAGSWSKYYGGTHAGQFTYGLPELADNASKIANSSRIANPGCYATAIILGSAPAISAKIIDGSDLVAVAASGTTGAGRTAKINLSASEVMNNLVSYKFGGAHQHTPEIEENLSALGNEKVQLSFTPILAPMPRGILATITSKLQKPFTTAEAHDLYSTYFKDSPFIKILQPGVMPQTSATLGTNIALLQVAVDSHANRLVISIAIDNLGKGAAGQAIQNANIVCGFPQDLGLDLLSVK
ncbi:MAG: N-acetyl-gamma-glutamyl-phosphate reductase [Candidatus Nanopelagicaceae bacterium]